MAGLFGNYSPGFIVQLRSTINTTFLATREEMEFEIRQPRVIRTFAGRYVSVHKKTFETGPQARVECSLSQDACPAAQTAAACTQARGGARCHGGAGGAASLAVSERCRMATPTDAMTEKSGVLYDSSNKTGSANRTRYMGLCWHLQAAEPESLAE